MKRFFAAAFLLLMVSAAVVPIVAQRPKELSTAVKFEKSPVRYAVAEASTDGRGVLIEWQTETETKNLGFYVYRIVGGEKQLVSQTFTSGAYLQAREEKITSGSYSLFDRYGDVNSTYVIESYNIRGRKDYSEVIQTKLVADLEAITGVSSEQLFDQSKNAKPIILRSETILPKDLANEVESSIAQSDPVTQRWVAAQPGAKIGVKTEGFYRVPRADLQAAGFDVNAPVARWQLYLNGIEQAINVDQNGNYIEFYGKGIDTLESETQAYFLVVGALNGKRIGTTLRRRVSSSVASASYSQSFFKKERLNYSQSYLNGDIENFYGSIVIGSGRTINFNLSGVDFNSPTASIDVALQGAVQVAHQTKVKINNTEIGIITGSDFSSMSQRFNISTSLLREGQNDLQLIPLGGSSDISYFDSVKVRFARRYQADQNQVSFFVPNYKATYVGNFTSPNVRVFDTTNPDSPVLISGLSISQVNGTYGVYLPSNRGRVMFAVEDSGLSQAFSVTQNTPSTLSTAANDGELIIISYKDWLPQAEDWANYRRAQGMTVKVVNVEDIFDEFNYGVLNSDSIRTFLQYAKNNWLTAPNYVLLLGDATYDPKNYLGTSNFNFVPTRLVDTIYSETGSDDTLADFNNDGLAEISIGRIPVRDGAAVTLALNRVITFEQMLAQNGLSRGAVFAYDSPNGYDFQALSERLRDQLPNNIPRIMVGRDMPDSHNLLINELNAGHFLVNYSGHGNVGVWAGSNFFTSTDAASLTNGNNLSIYTMLTCLNGYFIQPTDSMAEILLKNPNGGAVSTWASTGLTTADVQEVMATRFYNQMAAGNITRLGDLIRDAKTTINFGRDVRLSWVLLGDPTLKTR